MTARRLTAQPVSFRNFESVCYLKKNRLRAIGTSDLISLTIWAFGRRLNVI